jgi:ribose transport system substrate-binding protein
MRSAASNCHDSEKSYQVDAILRACAVLGAFQFEGEELRLRDVVFRTGIKTTTAYRVICSLKQGGLIREGGPHRYRINVRPLQRSKVRLGYAGQGMTSAFSREVGTSVRLAAEGEGVDLIELNNHYSPTIALRNADKLIAARVDLAIEYQSYEDVGREISSRFKEANIPLIAIANPHPGAIYYGADNHQVGRVAGHALGNWAKQNWNGQVDEVLLLGNSREGRIANQKLSGAMLGIREVLPHVDVSQFLEVSTGTFPHTLAVVRKYIRKSRAKRVLIASLNDGRAIAAIEAFEEAGCADRCAVVGQCGAIEGRAELRRPGTRLIGLVAYFPEHYGPNLISLALKILNNRPVPPAAFVKHRFLTAGNVDLVYPNDPLLTLSDRVVMDWQRP